MSEQPIVILDANAFIEGAGLLSIAPTHKLITTEEVMEELRDPKTRDLVQKFPFKIEQMEPEKKSVEFIKEFARKTGDISSLSDVDINLLALAHTLYVKKGLDSRLRKSPLPMKQVADENNDQYAQQNSQQEEQIHEQSDDPEVTQAEQQIDKLKIDENAQNKQRLKDQQTKKNDDNDDDQGDDGWIVVPKAKPKKKVQSDDDMDEDEGWVTPKNFDKKMAEGTNKFETQSNEQNKQQQPPSGISLMTVDFAMQNVALQVGIQIKSLDGRQIKEVRRFILECYLCWKQYKIEDNKVRLCKECGYNSLSKIAYSLKPNGQMILHRKKGWKPNQKVLEWKERKYEEQQRKKKHQHARRKKQPSIFDA